MEPRTFCFIAVFVGSSAFAFLALATPLTATEGPAAEEQKVLLDCRHSDYRTYIKCLKRQKRHHFQHGDGHGEMDGHCMDACLKKCDTDHDCDRSCSHCLKRTKHKHQIITEYETECESGDCSEKKNNLGSTNITTNIDINNIINTNVQGCQPCAPGSNCGCTHPNPTPIPPNRTDCCPPCHPPVPCHPSYPTFGGGPQLTLVPQITFGIGLGGFGGCTYPNQWPCLPPYPPQSTPPGVDCSGCGNPFLRYKCDVSCYVVQGTQQSAHINAGTPCRSPYCVGGT